MAYNEIPQSAIDAVQIPRTEFGQYTRDNFIDHETDIGDLDTRVTNLESGSSASEYGAWQPLSLDTARWTPASGRLSPIWRTIPPSHSRLEFAGAFVGSTQSSGATLVGSVIAGFGPTTLRAFGLAVDPGPFIIARMGSDDRIFITESYYASPVMTVHLDGLILQRYQ